MSGFLEQVFPIIIKDFLVGDVCYNKGVFGKCLIELLKIREEQEIAFEEIILLYTTDFEFDVDFDLNHLIIPPTSVVYRNNLTKIIMSECGTDCEPEPVDEEEEESEEEESEHEELPSDFECDEEDVHQTCGKTFSECECSFIRTLTSVYRGKETQYVCTCHPLFEDCECFYDQVYDPDGLM